MGKAVATTPRFSGGLIRLKGGKDGRTGPAAELLRQRFWQDSSNACRSVESKEAARRRSLTVLL